MTDEPEQETEQVVEEIAGRIDTSPKEYWLETLQGDLEECRNVAQKIDREYPSIAAVGGLHFLEERISDIADRDSRFRGPDRPDMIEDIIDEDLFYVDSLLMQVTVQFQQLIRDEEQRVEMDRLHYEVGRNINKLIRTLEDALEQIDEALDELEDGSEDEGEDDDVDIDPINRFK